ncbi:transcriptional regulator with XRE-family HTH domain [Micromonospora sp. HB375]|uniref:helix-turn-helix domain-containing protein n=1 Tax=unclassified Micromonospora TaxID=2617518 RepID=UPI001AE564F8|nr:MULTISPECIES: helix-turn-helix transcriptional regulator [unclassified Micromonospora]MBP1783329.1 transcriptional regulator with XRE-family HTH domain [Micromonospora sp. HB375]MDH6468978.1 transcriptional regulator with XRE-family HTH domain [Micromonospora sp. H404/HB375]
MADDMGSTVPRRQLGRALRDLRTEARMTLDGAAEAMQCSRQKMWRIETGLGPTRAVDAKAMCELYSATPELTTALVALANETKAKGWWHSYDLAIPDWFEMYVGLESAASRLRGYDESLVPGLLQVPAYTQGVYQNRRNMSEAEFDQVLAVRRQRKALLTRKLPAAPTLHSVLYEAVLLRNVGGRSAMAEQLTHLLELAEFPNVSIRVLPLAAGAPYGAMAGTFMMLDFPLRNRVVPDPSVVYCESLTGALYLDRPAEIAAYERVWSSLDVMALDEGQSKQLINKIVGEIQNG